VISEIRHKLFEFRAVIWAYCFYFVWCYKKPNTNRKTIKKLKSVLHINTDDLSGGAAKIVRDLTTYQKNKGLDVHLFVKEKKSDDDCSHSIEQNTSKAQHFLGYAAKKLQWQDFFHLSSFTLPNNYLVKNADIVHLHNLHGDYFSYLALPKLSSKKHIVWSMHDMHAFTGHCSHSFSCEKWKEGCGNCPDLSIYPAINKDTTAFIHQTKQKAYEKSQLHIVALSDWLKQKLENSILKNQNIHLIYNGIDTSVFKLKNKQEIRKQLNLPASKTIVLFSANLGAANPFKGGVYLNHLVDYYKGSENILFVAVGNSKEIEFTQSNLLSVPYISSPVVMADYYNASDVYLYPSLADNCPLVALEAMGCGLPVLAFNTGGTPELVLHKETGYIANYKDVDDLINGFDWLLSDTERLKKFGINSVRRVEEYFTLERMNEEYLKLYEEIAIC
jgi:glycosyltransferase involved in cell wall biosynthesis